MRNKFDYDFKWWQSPNINTTMNEDINPKMLLTKEEIAEMTTHPDLEAGERIVQVRRGDVAITIDPMMRKEELKGEDMSFTINADKIDYEKVKTPNYYVGEVFGYEARKIIEDFDLSYNIGTCVSYLLRAKRKHDSQIECIAKAINHLEFELERLKRDEKTNL